MASSRWKRFAFFERQNLAIPDAVWNDLTSDIRSSSSHAKSVGAASAANAVIVTTTPPSPTTTTSVSLTVSTAALPAHTKPVGPKPPASPTAESSSVDAIAAMWSSLTACSPAFTNADDAPSYHAASATGTVVVGTSAVVQLPSQGQQALASSSSVVAACASSTTTTTTTTVLDGLVLAFAASPGCSRIHCLDVTVRCNPPGVVPPRKQAAAVTAPSEDMDGWRGYWSPFRTTPPPQPIETSAGSQNRSGGVVAVATCRVPAFSTNKDNGRPQQTPPHQQHRAAVHSPLHVACLGSQNQLVVWEDPHLHLSCRQPVQDTAISTTSNGIPTDVVVYQVQQQQLSSGSSNIKWWNTANDGSACVLDICPGMVAVGTDIGVVLVYAYHTTITVRPTVKQQHQQQQQRVLRPYLRIPPPPVTGMQVISVRLSASTDNTNNASIFVAYNRQVNSPSTSSVSVNAATATTTAGICCYDLPLPSNHQQQVLSAPSARYDLDGRYVGSSSLVDAYPRRQGGGLILTVARLDGLYSYSHTERTGVAPIDGTKLAICIIPPPVPAEKVREVDVDQVGSGYALVASTDSKSGRDAVDIYDSTNKLVAFHLLLSPGHNAVRAAGVTTLPTHLADGSFRGGRSSAVVLTSGGALVTFTEKLTEEKVSLLVQKNLYSAAIVVAYADPSYEASDITTLYQRYAEHLYRKGDFSGATDQYMHTIGSLESSHVIFRYLDAPKIPLLVRYLEKLRSRELATPVHNELLRTCYLKLNDMPSAEALVVSASWSVNDASLDSIMSNLSSKPKDALATICSLEAHQAAEVLVVHGALLARVLPRETAGVVISLCVGTYAPKALADASMAETLGEAAATTTAAAMDLKKMVSTNDHAKAMVIEPYPVHLFAAAFVEHPRILRLLLAHCNRNKCHLTPSLRRTLLELTLAEWNQAKRSGDTEAEKLRHKEAIASLTDSHCRDIGDYEALVIVQLAGFEEGELLLYERLQMTTVLLERYARDGCEKSRRQMLAMCQTDPEILADVLGYFVEIASEKSSINKDVYMNAPDDGSENDEAAEILEDIQEALTLARRQGVLPPVRIARILAGEGPGQFSSDRPIKERKKTVPLSVALDYVGTVLEKSRKEASRLKSEIEEYNQLCNSMENEIDSLLRASYAVPLPSGGDDLKAGNYRLNIEELFTKVKSEQAGVAAEEMSEQAREAFWREMNQTEDSFDTISRYFAKGVIS